MCCSVLQFVAVCCSVFVLFLCSRIVRVCCSACAMCCSVVVLVYFPRVGGFWGCVAVYRSVSQYVALIMCCSCAGGSSVCFPVCCSVLLCVAVCCSVLQCVAVCGSARVFSVCWWIIRLGNSVCVVCCDSACVVCCNLLQRVAVFACVCCCLMGVCCSVLLLSAMCCSVLQFFALLACFRVLVVPRGVLAHILCCCVL